MKTGTTSLNTALSILGYKVCHNSWAWIYDIVLNRWNSIASKARAYDAFEDNPISLIYKELDQLFPNSKFILTIRDQESWFKSVDNHIGTNRTHMHEWVFGNGKGLPKDDKAHAINVFNLHNQAVIEYFKSQPKRLLVLDITKTDSWEELCSFLNAPIPEAAFPHANKATYQEIRPRGLKAIFKSKKRKTSMWFRVKIFRLLGLFPTPAERIEKITSGIANNLG